MSFEPTVSKSRNTFGVDSAHDVASIGRKVRGSTVDDVTVEFYPITQLRVAYITFSTPSFKKSWRGKFTASVAKAVCDADHVELHMVHHESDDGSEPRAPVETAVAVVPA